MLATTFSSLTEVVDGRRPLRLAFHSVGELRGRLFFDVRPLRTSARPDPRLEAVRRVIARTRLASSSTCRMCGGPAHRRLVALEWALCDHHADAVDQPPVPASIEDRTFALYRIEEISAALGEAPATTCDQGVPHDGTGHQAHLRGILDAGERARWRSLVRPDEAGLDDLDDLDRRAPHMREVTGLVRRHLRAALVIGRPIRLPPLMLVGEPGIGKSWYLSRLAQVLRVPFRHYPMNLSSLGEGLFGAHASWRNARPGLVARTLLSEPVANVMILVDEADKPPLIGAEDPYRAFYGLLEPEGARSFVDEYLSFPMDASAILWVLAGNSTDALPPPIVDRLTVVRIPAMDEGQLRAVAASVYGEANANCDGFFDAELREETMRHLLGTNVRGIRRAVDDAMVRAAADGRRSIGPGDVVVHEGGTDRRIGFMRERRP
ncbi:AAA family ATPase [Lichenibacterium dinghuense]|uniref:AAA family ATPase n=1 Tax=Lichenibacterium dinghuense TaxID=2895977 RepID=UPI001F02D243|nr:AAA family ATPase [Lichenibacterium sp. 6Y81]